jgi:two-component system phosphate regulon sensor histidine kinase PhoR
MSKLSSSISGTVGWVFISINLLIAAAVCWLGISFVMFVQRLGRIIQRLKDNGLADLGSSGRKGIGFFLGGYITQLGRALRTGFESYLNEKVQLSRQLRELELELGLSQRRERNTEAIIYGIRDGVIVLDEFDKLLMANEAAAKLFNFDHRQAQRQELSTLINADKKQFTDFLSKARQKKARGVRREFEFEIEQDIRTFDVIVSCVYDDREQVCGVVGVLHDITKEKEVSQMKNDFVSHVSHELKTPLASITAYSEMLVDGEAEDEKTRQEFYNVIQSQAKRLNRLIEDILNVSRIESGLIKVQKEPVSMALLIEEQLAMIKSFAEDKGIKVNWGSDDRTSDGMVVIGQVYADRDMISQVVVNLLSNAVKYTPNGGEVRIDSEVDEDSGVVRVSVNDTGVGIPTDEVDHVFDKFYRVKANNSQAKGTGLGLNLVKQIVEKIHNGKVFVQSEVGVGSTFGFELPLATSAVVG